MAKLADLIEAKQEASSRLLLAPDRVRVLESPVAKSLKEAGQGLHAVGVGRKISNGKQTRTLCVRLYVLDKVAESKLSGSLRLPKQIAGVPTDVVEAPLAVFHQPRCSVNRRRRQRPVIAGISAASRLVSQKSTLGCFCHSRRQGEADSLYMLGCNHSFANLNNGPAGVPILQPAAGDGGVAGDRIGTLGRFVPMVFGLSSTNRVDAAIAKVAPQIAVSNQICSIGPITGIVQAMDDMTVCKHGRTTGYTEGRIDDASMDAYVINYSDEVVAVFVNQIRTDPTLGYNAPPGETMYDGWFAAPGDSGSVIVNRKSRRAVGLHFAGQYGISVANPIQDVCQLLRIAIP